MSRPRKKPPRKIDLDHAIENMPLTNIQCRDFGHSWRPFTARWDSDAHCFVTTIRCQRCKAERHRLIGAAGQQIKSHYDYADGYLVKGMGRLTGSDRDRIRLASVLRVLPPDTAEE